jgi:hypothetical protein
MSSTIIERRHRYFSSSPLKNFLPVEVGDNSQDADDDEIDTNQIIEYLGEYHDDNAENEACYAHP